MTGEELLLMMQGSSSICGENIPLHDSHQPSHLYTLPGDFIQAVRDTIQDKERYLSCGDNEQAPLHSKQFFELSDHSLLIFLGLPDYLCSQTIYVHFEGGYSGQQMEWQADVTSGFTQTDWQPVLPEEFMKGSHLTSSLSQGKWVRQEKPDKILFDYSSQSVSVSLPATINLHNDFLNR